MFLLELCDASATDVKVFHLILSANSLVLSHTIIIKAIIIVQGLGKDKIPFITLKIGKRNLDFMTFSETAIYDLVHYGSPKFFSYKAWRPVYFS